MKCVISTSAIDLPMTPAGAVAPAGVRKRDGAAQATASALPLGFLRLSVAALLVAGVFAFIVSIARTWLVVLIAGRSYLFTALVAHVTFALNVWLLSFTAVLWVLLAARVGRPLPARPAGLGLALTWIGAALLAVTPLLGLGQPVLADYVPVLLHPLFLLGLGAFACGIGLVASAYLASTQCFRLQSALEVQAAGVSAAAYLLALAAFLAAAIHWGTADIATVVWGGGHLLQVVNASALVAGWALLAPEMAMPARRMLRLSLVGFVLSALTVGVLELSSIGWPRLASIFWSGIGIPVVLGWIIVLATIAQRWRRRLPVPNLPFLLISLALLGAGGLIALTGMGSDTRVTAHYHGTVGSVSVAFMGLTYVLLPKFNIDLAWKKLSRFEPYLYGGGLLLLIIGLFWAGEAGIARKTFEAISNDPRLIVPAGLFGIGALATVAGGVVFVMGVGLSLLRELRTDPRELTAHSAVTAGSQTEIVPAYASEQAR